MLNLQYKGEYIHNPIHGKLDNIIDVMVANRGEQYREQITDRLKKAHYMFTRGDNQVLHERVLEDYLKRIEELKNQFENEDSYLTKDIQRFDRFITLDEEGITDNYYYWLRNTRILTELGIIEHRNEILQKREAFFKTPEVIERIKTEQARLSQNEVYKEWKTLTEKKNELDALIRQETDNLSNLDSTETSFRLKELEKVRSLAKNDYLKSHIVGEKEVVTWGNTSVGGCVINFIGKENQLENLMICPNLFYIDTVVAIHELGHLAESVLLEVNENMFVVKTGLEITEHAMSEESEQRTVAFDDNGQLISVPLERKRPYELLNEVVHDYLACQEAEEYKNKHGSIGYANDFESMYSLGFDIFGPFIERHKSKIIECVHAEDFTSVKEYFGFAIFNKLAKLANDYVLERNECKSTIKTAKKDLENPEKTHMIDELQKIIADAEAKIEKLKNKYLCELLQLDIELHNRNGLDASEVQEQLREVEEIIEQQHLQEEMEEQERIRAEEELARIEEIKRNEEKAKMELEQEQMLELERVNDLFYPLTLTRDEYQNLIFENALSLGVAVSDKIIKLQERLEKYKSFTNEKAILEELEEKTGEIYNVPSDICRGIVDLKKVKGKLSKEAIEYIRFVLGTNKLSNKVNEIYTKYNNKLDRRAGLTEERTA